MLRLVAFLLAYVWPCCSVRADGREERSREAFEQGVAFSAAAQWEQAAAAFEASLEAIERPAARFNLVIAYRELARPLEVARHAIAFLRYPEHPTYAEARAKAEGALANALLELAIITTQRLPETAELLIDGGSPIRDDTRRVYSAPGPHRLELKIANEPAEGVDVQLRAGQVIEWPRAPATIATEPSSTPTEPVSLANGTGRAPTARSAFPPLDGRDLAPERRWRSRLALSLGVTGGAAGAAALVAYGVELWRAKGLRDQDPFQAGFLSAANDYLRVQTSVVSLAAIGGVLMASAVAVGPRAACSDSRTLAWGASITGAVLAATGTFLAARKSPLIEDTDVERPVHELGVVLVSAAAPLLSYGIKSWFSGRRDRVAAGRGSASCGAVGAESFGRWLAVPSAKGTE
jgi:hypothetical protein